MVYYTNDSRERIERERMKYPVGPQALKKAAQTEAGKLASLLNRVLYEADSQDIPLKETPSVQVKRWVAPYEFFKNDDPMPDGIPVAERGAMYCETEALMRAIRDYLEFKSLEEVIP